MIFALLRAARRLTWGLMLLALIALIWWAALWWWIAPDFSHWRLPALAFVHVVPPVLGWGSGWWAWRIRRARKANDAAAQETRAEHDRRTTLEAARQTHAVEQQRLHFGCDCRAVSIVWIEPPESNPAPFVPTGEGIFSTSIVAEEWSSEQTILDHMRPAIEEALDALYAGYPEAVYFPIYVAPPSEAVGDEVIRQVQAIRTQLAAGVGESGRSAQSVVVRYLPNLASAADSVIGLLESNVELPGALVLAFDSPWFRAQGLAESGQEDTFAYSENRAWIGAPGQGVFVLLLTHPQLAKMLGTLPTQQQQYGVMTPYWEKERSAAGSSQSVILASIPDHLREGLSERPPLARIHRSAQSTFTHNALRTAYAQGVKALIERAQIHAALIDRPFDVASEPVAPSPDSAVEDGGWLVHNAGGVDRAGNRLAALSLALLNRGLEIDPIDQATNVTVKAGDLGQARSIAMLALTVAQASGADKAMCAEFDGDDRLTLYFVRGSQGVA